MPIEPSGTSPISTLCPDSRSHNIDPAPIPIEKTANSSVDTATVPPMTSFVRLGKLVRKIEPKNHSQEIPSSELKIAGWWRASFRFAQVSLKGFQFRRNAGSAAGERGTKRLRHLAEFDPGVLGHLPDGLLRRLGCPFLETREGRVDAGEQFRGLAL